MSNPPTASSGRGGLEISPGIGSLLMWGKGQPDREIAKSQRKTEATFQVAYQYKYY